MLVSAAHYALRHPRRLMGAIVSDPAGVIEKLQDRIVQQWEYRQPVFHHEPSLDWDRRMHEWLGIPFPCRTELEFDSLWPDVLTSVQSKGIDVGPASFAGYNDGDRALIRALWCLVRHLKAVEIVETGVGHGFTSRFILEAQARNGRGRLHSIDRPPLDPATRARVGIAVPPSLRSGWDLLSGSSRRCLPGLLSRLGLIDIFVHDSLHTRRNVCFELAAAWAVLRPGGALVIDDIDSNAGYGTFLQTITGHRALVCEAEPIRPDGRRFNGKGLFALVLKVGA